MPQDASTPIWALEHPETVRAVQTAYLEAGAQLLVTPNFGGNRRALEAFGRGAEAASINAQLARATRETAADRALVAGGLSGLGISLPPVGEERFETLVSLYQEQVAAMEPFVDLFFIESITELADARAAAMAIRSLSDRPFFVSVACDGEGRLADGTDVLAALIVMQGLGAAAFGIGCTPAEIIIEQSARLVPYAMIPLLAKPCGGSDFVQSTHALAQVGVRLFGGCCESAPREIAQIRDTLAEIDFAQLPVPEYTSDPDVIACASGGQARFITPDVDVGDGISCHSDMLADILAAEEDTYGALKVQIFDEEDLLLFEENQYAIREALCIEAEEPQLLEVALRVFQGRAFHDGLTEIAREELERLKNQYGLVLL